MGCHSNLRIHVHFYFCLVMWTPLPTVLLSIFAGYFETNAYKFTEQEDEDLRQVLWTLGFKFSWKKVSACMQFRNDLECCVRWREMQNLKNKKKGYWMPDEDILMKDIIKHRGAENWRLIACYIPGRTSKQCRERWHNHLDRKINKGNWTSHETQIVMDMQRVHGNKWAKIASYIPGRTDNMVKNRWYSYCIPTLKKQGFSTETSPLRPKDASPPFGSIVHVHMQRLPLVQVVNAPITFSPDTISASFFDDFLQDPSFDSVLENIIEIENNSKDPFALEDLAWSPNEQLVVASPDDVSFFQSV